MKRLVCQGAFGIALILGLLLPAVAPAQDSVMLRFAWPDEQSGRVDFTLRHESQHNTNPPVALEASGSTRFAVSPSADYLIVDFEEASVGIESHTASDDQKQFAAVIVPLSLQRADYRVSRAGDFLGLDDPRSFMQSMRSAIDARINTIPEDLLVHVRPTMELTLSQANFRSVMESGWRSEVGRWIDKSLQHGQPLIVEEMQDLPVFGDAEAPAQVSYRFIGHAPCGNGDDGCVELEVRAVIDGPEAIQASQLAMRISGNTRLDVTRYRTETTGRVITDPDTLVPYQSHLEWRHTTELTSEFETISIRESGVLATTYIYD